jgi:hypothetical protein
MIASLLLPLLLAQVQDVTARIPDDVFLYVRLAGLERAANELQQTAPYRIWTDPDLADDLATVRTLLRRSELESLEREATATTAAFERLRRLFRGPAHLVARGQGGRTRYTLLFEGLVMPAGKEGPQALAELLRAGTLAGILKGAPAVENAGKSIALRFPHPCTSLRGALVGTTWILTDDPGILPRLCDPDAEGERPPGSLAANPVFRRIRTAVGGDDPTLFAFVDPGRLGQDTMPPRTPEQTAALDAFPGIGFTLALRNGRVVGRIHVDVPGGLEAMFPGLRGGPTRAAAAAAAPATTVLMAALPFDAVLAHEALLKSAQDPEPSGLRRVHDLLYRGIGLKLTDELLQPLGREITFLVILPGDSSLFPELGAAIEVRNQAALEATLQQVMKEQLGLRPRTMPFEGHTIHYGLGDQTGVSLRRDLPTIYLAPSYVFAHGRLLMGSRPLAVKRMLQALERKTPSLLDDPRFQESLAKDLQGSAPAGLLYFDTRRLFDHACRVAMHHRLPGFVPDDANEARFLRPDVLARHLSSSLNALFLAPASAELRSFSTGASLTMAAALAGAGLVAVDLHDRIHGIGTDTAALHGQLTAVGQAASRVRAREGALPTALAPLTAAVAARGGPELPELVLVAVPDGQPTRSPEAILAYPAAPGPLGCRFFVRANGDVDWLPEAEFQKTLAEQTAPRR